MKYAKLIVFNSIVIGLGIAAVQILDLLTIFYLVPVFYAILLIFNEKLRAKPLVLGLTILLGWLVALAVLLPYIKLRTCADGVEEWFCQVEGIFPYAIIFYALLQSGIVTSIALIANRVKRST
jgi:hypothetical protein